MADLNRIDAYTKFRNQQRKAPRVRGTLSRSKYLFDLRLGELERGTRAKSRPLPSRTA